MQVHLITVLLSKEDIGSPTMCTHVSLEEHNYLSFALEVN
jgi:hypothetical protein